ncbi:M20/M25/M40 family metallo-hydrolase [Actinomadura kijaniata]|uniref:M20/M25/M40 family metallo-hydrolase n=1 Tax=Actinomadura kijaniata TaxID=46161 RepID=UPI0035E428B8
MLRKFALGAVVALPVALPPVTLVTVPPAAAGPDLARSVTAKDVRRHLESLQAIAEDNGGDRAMERSGYDASVRYVVGRLRKAGFTPAVRPFTFRRWEPRMPPVLTRVSPGEAAYQHGTDYAVIEHSGSGDVTAGVTPVDVPADGGVGDAGCQAEDFAGFPRGNIALVQRGTCNFVVKADHARAAGASAVVIYNRPGQGGLVRPSLEAPRTLPAVFVTREVGADLLDAAREETPRLRIRTDSRYVRHRSSNIIADTRWGRPDRVVVVGAHLDSVPGGAGVNDNGTGVAAVLAVAQKIHKLGSKQIRNRVRFAFWGAEEEGLRGSRAYVKSLPAAQRSKIALNLNFDMLGSVNGVRGVYDGDGSTGSNGAKPPPGSGAIEKTFRDYYARRRLPLVETEFSGRSDYGPFIEAGIPAGGLFSGAEMKKTPEEAKLFGGRAGEPYDPCYHQGCDTIGNVHWKLLDTHVDGVAFAVQRFAGSTLPVNGEVRGRARSLGTGPGSFAWVGDRRAR